MDGRVAVAHRNDGSSAWRALIMSSQQPLDVSRLDLGNLSRKFKMPKLYEYFGLTVMFYSNEHDPVHVHGKCQGRELRAEIILVNGVVQEVVYKGVAGRASLDSNELRYFQELVSSKADEIVAKWIDFFVLNKSVSSERITKRLK